MGATNQLVAPFFLPVALGQLANGVADLSGMSLFVLPNEKQPLIQVELTKPWMRQSHSAQ